MFGLSKKSLIGAIVFPSIFGVCFFFWLKACVGTSGTTDALPNSPNDSPSLLENPQALHEKYGGISAIECSSDADDYVKSVARYEFKWDDSGMLDPKFNKYVVIYVAPGVTTSISDKLLVQNGFGAFKREELYCNYDTQQKKVLRYWIVDNDN